MGNGCGKCVCVLVGVLALASGAVAAAPGKAQLLRPTGAVTDRRPAFQWQAVSGAEWYHIYIYRGGAYHYDKWVESNSWTPSWDMDNYLGAYKWWVQTWNSEGFGQWSSGETFSIGRPVLQSPADTVTSSRPTFRWSSATTATWYKIWIRRQGNDHYSDWVNQNSWTPHWDMDDYPGDYEWWVVPWNANGYGQWSEGKRFWIGGSNLSAPSPQSPDSGEVILESRPTFSWNSVSDADWYKFRLRKVDDWDWTEWVRATSTSFRPSDWRLDPGSYTWWVEGYSYSRGYGSWSRSASFKVALPVGTPTPISPAGNVTVRNPQFSWRAASNAEHYLLRITGNGMDRTFGPTEATSYLLSEVSLGEGTYEWSVRAEGQYDVTSDWSDPVTITVTSILRNVTAHYRSPYLLDFDFSLRDQDDHALVVDPEEISITCMEDGNAISRTETAFQLVTGDKKQLKCFLVLDYTNSMADPVTNGDKNGDGKSDAVEAMEEAAKAFIDSLKKKDEQVGQDGQVGIYEFHRNESNWPPRKISDFTTNSTDLAYAIDHMWDEPGSWYPAGSRCWDAVYAALGEFSGGNTEDERRFLIFLSDGRDESSVKSPGEIVDLARNYGVSVYCIGSGAELDPAPLAQITSGTGGQYYPAGSVTELTARFEQITHDLQGQYILRWATLKKTPFSPSFVLSVDGMEGEHTAAHYDPNSYAGDPNAGTLRFVADPVVEGSTKLTLRSVYTPRYITRIRFFVHSTYSFIVSQGGLCGDWTIEEESDELSGGTWVEIHSQDPDNIYSGISFGAMGAVMEFHFEGVPSVSACFNVFDVDNTIYGGGQTFSVANVSDVLTPNETPTASNDSVITAGGYEAEIDVLGNDYDTNGDELVVVWVSTPEHGSTSIVASSAAVTYRPEEDYLGSDSFVYTISDQAGRTAEAVVELTVVEPLSLQPDSATTPMNTAIDIFVLWNDSGPEPDETLTLREASVPQHGSVSISGDRLVYQPEADWLGTDSFSYTAAGASGVTATAQVSVDIQGAVDDSFAVRSDTASTALELFANDHISGDSGWYISEVGTASAGTIEILDAQAGRVIYYPQANSIGQCTFTYTVMNGAGVTDAAEVALDVAPSNAQYLAEVDGHRYYWIQEYAAWDDAKSKCESLGGHLVTLTTESEANTVEEWLRNAGADQASVWIGHEDQDHDGMFAWVNGEESTYSDWADGEPGEPSAQDECVYISSGSWSAASRSAFMTFVLEIE